jgi:hypothetical protein
LGPLLRRAAGPATSARMRDCCANLSRIASNACPGARADAGGAGPAPARRESRRFCTIGPTGRSFDMTKASLIVSPRRGRFVATKAGRALLVTSSPDRCGALARVSSVSASSAKTRRSKERVWAQRWRRLSSRPRQLRQRRLRSKSKPLTSHRNCSSGGPACAHPRQHADFF